MTDADGFDQGFGLGDFSEFDEEANYDTENLGAEPRTVCPNCYGIGEVPKAVLAVIAGVVRTVNTGAVCPLCEGASALPRMTLPV